MTANQQTNENEQLNDDGLNEVVTYKGYRVFQDIECPKLRSWNQFQTAVNIEDSNSKLSADEYIDNLPPKHARMVRAVANHYLILCQSGKYRTNQEAFEQLKKELTNG